MSWKPTAITATGNGRTFTSPSRFTGPVDLSRTTWTETSGPSVGFAAMIAVTGLTVPEQNALARRFLRQ